jgi:hypothetical protein
LLAYDADPQLCSLAVDRFHNPTLGQQGMAIAPPLPQDKAADSIAVLHDRLAAASGLDHSGELEG